jgi:hypothetical protein
MSEVRQWRAAVIVMPQLNDDGLQGFSANDWLAPAVGEFASHARKLATLPSASLMKRTRVARCDICNTEVPGACGRRPVCRCCSRVP